MSAFALEGRCRLPHLLGVRGAGRPLGDVQWLDRAPRGATETMVRGLGDLRAGVWYAATTSRQRVTRAEGCATHIEAERKDLAAARRYADR